MARNVHFGFLKNLTIKLAEKQVISLKRRKNYFIFAKTKIFKTTHFWVWLCLCHAAEWAQPITLSTEVGHVSWNASRCLQFKPADVPTARTDDPIHIPAFSPFICKQQILHLSKFTKGDGARISHHGFRVHTPLGYMNTWRPSGKLRTELHSTIKTLKTMPRFFSILVLTKVLFYFFSQVKCSSLLDFLWLLMFKTQKKQK